MIGLLTQVLCELEMAMVEKGVVPLTYVSRSIMSPEIRFIKDGTNRNMRDWFIFKDYMNSMDQTLKILKSARRRLKLKNALFKLGL